MSKMDNLDLQDCDERVADDAVDSKEISVGSSFSSFEEFKDSFEHIKKKGFHLFHVFNSQSGKDYNRKRANKKCSDEVIDESKFQYTYYSVRCVHYGVARSRSKGLRPNQRHFSLGCEAKITVSYDRLSKRLAVTEFNLVHNHRVGEAIFQHHPIARRLSKEEEKDIKEIIQLRPNSKLVRNLITHKYGKQLTLKDIHNIKAKTKEEARGN